ncbi:MAG: hypothetical protein M5U33_03460 [Pseudorhodoplanes sp.]|nr:hypothetical protein [Pseudorhodoplanes sp.]
MIHRFNDGLLVVIAVIVVFVLFAAGVRHGAVQCAVESGSSKTSHNTLIEVIWTVVRDHPRRHRRAIPSGS